MSVLKNAEIFFVSTEYQTAIKQFAKVERLENQTNIHFLSLPQDQVYQTFGTAIIPHVFVYENNILVKELSGFVPIQKLITRQP